MVIKEVENRKYKDIIICLLVTMMIVSSLDANAVAIEGPKYGGTLIIGQVSEPPTLNPGVTTGVYVTTVTNQIFSGLVRYDRDMNLLPELAESWEIEEDKLTFHLLENVTWHDGVLFTSADVVFSFDQVLTKLVRQRYFAAIDRVEALDEFTVILYLEYFSAPLLIYLGVHHAPIIPKHLYEGTDIEKNPYNLEPVGTGPFKFNEWKKGSHLTLERNDHYFKSECPYLDRIIFKFFGDSSAMVMALEGGESDYIPQDCPPEDVERLEASPNIEAPMSPTSKGWIERIWMNMDNPILADTKVRQALSYAVDRETLLEVVKLGQGKVATGPISSSSPNLQYWYNPNLPTYDYDVSKANELLDEVYPKGENGIRFKLGTLVQKGEVEEIGCVNLIKDMWGQVGVELEIEILDAATHHEKIWVDWDYDTAVLNIVSGPDPSQGSKYIHSEQIQHSLYVNPNHYNNSRVDWLFDEAVKTLDKEQRRAYYWEIQEIMAEEAGEIWLYERYICQPYRTDFVGTWLPQDLYVTESLDDVWWKKGREITIETTPETTILSEIVPRAITLVIFVCVAGFYRFKKLRKHQ